MQAKQSTLLYLVLAVLGIVFLAPILSSFIQGGIASSMILLLMFLAIIGAVFLATGIIGVGSQYLAIPVSKSKLAGDSKKHLKLYAFFTILGIFFLGIFSLILYWNSHSAEVSRYLVSTPLATLLVFIIFFFGGIGFLTVGVCWLGRHYVKHKSLFTVFATIVILSLILLPFFYITMVAPFEDIYAYPLRSEIIRVTVVDTDPLILSIGVKAITSSDSRIDQAIIINSNNELVAETSLNDRERVEYNGFKGLALAVLPAGSEITLTLNFNATLPSGNYTVRLASWGANHGKSSFNMP